MLVLPSVKKACVVCNGTLTFYTLPELSPAFGGKIKQPDCVWVGGLDENRTYEEGEEVIIVICLKSRLRLIRIGESARRTRDIEVPGCVMVRRRGDLACVADDKSYSLIDVVNQRKNDLFPISSAIPSPPRSPATSDWPSPYQTPRQSFEEARPRPNSMHIPPATAEAHLGGRGHERIASLGAQPKNTGRLTAESPPRWPSRDASRLSGDGSNTPSRSRSPLAVRAAENVMRPASPQLVQQSSPHMAALQPVTSATPLLPIILTPTPNEFLLATGTGASEPGVGMFVNEDGDVSRGTLEFSTYPRTVVLDAANSDHEIDQDPQLAGSQPVESFIIALTFDENRHSYVLEIQPLDGEQHPKSVLGLPPSGGDDAALPNVCRSTSQNVIATPEIIRSLGQRRLPVSGADEATTDADAKRAEQEDSLIERFASTTARCIFFSGHHIWWLVRHPLLIKLDSQLGNALKQVTSSKLLSVQRQEAEFVFNDLRGREPQDEIQFLTFNYIRQKAAVLMLLDLLIRTAQSITVSDRDIRYTQDALIDSGIEPRVILSLIPILRDEIIEGPNGIWVPGGLKELLETIRSNEQIRNLSHETSELFWSNILPVIKTVLMSWRRKKGFGSIADEEQVFRTVDAALVHVLLILDQRSPSGPATAGSLRAELNEVMDRGVECFDRAVFLLEDFHRLYVLSRLYQNKKMTALVLATWKRILEGEDDRGGEMLDGEIDVRKYLGRIKDANLVRDYGTWLANRNPSLGVQIFADDNSRVKFSPVEAVDLLKAKAPNAVRYYLEYLVFTKRQPQYSEDLINFYLEALLVDLSGSGSTAADMLRSGYEIYSSLPPPKPTYMQFINDNAPDAEWHRNRMRLLQLLESIDSKSSLDLSSLATRLKPYDDLLIPEKVILYARQGQHPAALQILVHRLADFDTAIRYALRGGKNVFQPAAVGSTPSPPRHVQDGLLSALLAECMALSDPEPRLARSAELLDRFAPRFELAEVLPRVPTDWPVAVVQGFLAAKLRELVAARRESGVLRALAAGQNLAVSVKHAERLEAEKMVLQTEGEPGAMSFADSGYGSSLGVARVDDDDFA